MRVYEEKPGGRGVSRRAFLKRAGLSAGAIALSGPLSSWRGFAQGGTIEIGALLTMTGPLAAYGNTLTNAVQLALQDANAAGGPMGRSLDVIVRDSTTDPTTLRDATQKLVEVDKVPAMVGPMVRSDVAVPITAPNHVVTVSPTNTPEWVTRLKDDDFNFRTTVSDAVQGTVLGELAWSLGYRSASSIYVNDPYGGALSAIAAGRFKEVGGQVFAQVAYNEGQPSYETQLLIASRGNPDVLMLLGYVEDGITIMREALSGGYFDEFLFADGMKAQKIADVIGEPLEGMYGTSPGSVKTASYDTYHEEFQGAYGHAPQTGFSENAYDAAAVIALAIHAAGPDAFQEDPGAAIRDRMRTVANPPGEKVGAGADGFAKAFNLLDAGEQINYEGASGPIDFDENGDVSSPVLIWKIEGGKIVAEDSVNPGEILGG